jgi:hypothetical protein
VNHRLQPLDPQSFPTPSAPSVQAPGTATPKISSCQSPGWNGDDTSQRKWWIYICLPWRSWAFPANCSLKPIQIDFCCAVKICWRSWDRMELWSWISQWNQNHDSSTMQRESKQNGHRHPQENGLMIIGLVSNHSIQFHAIFPGDRYNLEPMKHSIPVILGIL